MERRVLLDIVVTQSSTVLELFPAENEALLIRRDAFLVLNLRLDRLDRIGRLNVQRNGLARESFHKDLRHLGFVS